MARALVLVGRGPYEDPWHDHAATSCRVARILEGAGHTVTLRSLFPDEPPDLSRTDLLVVNAGSADAGGGDRPAPGGAARGAHHAGPAAAVGGTRAEWAALHAAVDAHVAAGGPVLALHQSANTFPDHPGWAEVLGGRWVEGTSWHPPLDADPPARVHVRAHDATAGVADFDVVDERYTDLHVSRDVEVLASHVEDGVEHPLAWARRAGHARVVYDALGHDVRSYDSPGRVRLLHAEVAWLLRG